MKIILTIVLVFFSINVMAKGDSEKESMQGMDHSRMKGMDHSGMQGMNHDDMEGMDHADGDGDDHNGSHANSAGTPLPATPWVDVVIDLSLHDSMKIEYSAQLNIRAGNVVKFVITNEGKARHEFSISNAEEQIAHVAMMRKMPDMKHEDGTTISLESGETKELYWKFDGEPEVVFSCNIPGHSEAGMLTYVKIDGTHGNDENDHT